MFKLVDKEIVSILRTESVANLDAWTFYAVILLACLMDEKSLSVTSVLYKARYMMYHNPVVKIII